LEKLKLRSFEIMRVKCAKINYINSHISFYLKTEQFMQ